MNCNKNGSLYCNQNDSELITEGRGSDNSLPLFNLHVDTWESHVSDYSDDPAWSVAMLAQLLDSPPVPVTAESDFGVPCFHDFPDDNLSTMTVADEVDGSYAEGPEERQTSPSQRQSRCSDESHNRHCDLVSREPELEKQCTEATPQSAAGHHRRGQSVAHSEAVIAALRAHPTDPVGKVSVVAQSRLSALHDCGEMSWMSAHPFL